MKSMKKALAAFLAVLMLVFSVPFTAFAADCKPNVHLVANTLYGDTGSVYWGPLWVDDSAPVTNLEAGTVYAVSFVLTGCNGSQLMQISGTYDYNKISPASVTANRKGVLSYTYDEFCVETDDVMNMWAGHAGSEYSIVAAGSESYADGSSVMSGPTAHIPYRFSLAKVTVDHSIFTGKTVFTGAYSYELDEEMTVEVDGSYLATAYLQIKQNMTIDELYGAFTLDTWEFDDENGVTYPITFGPASTEPTPPAKDTYTYTYLNGDVKTVEVEAGATPEAPALTADSVAHIANTETHKTTTYSWAADGDKAFKETAKETTAACAFKTTTAAVDPIHTKDQLVDGSTAVETCEACGFVKGGDVITAKHAHTKTEVAATCKTQAHDLYTCDCGHTLEDNFHGDLAEHSWKVTGTEGEANCVTPGKVNSVCTVCGETKQEDGQLGAHTLTAHAAVAAKCEETGNDAYWTCDVCNKIFADADATTVLDAIPTTPVLGHSFTNYVNNNDATCQANATETAKCDRCDKADTREVPDSTVDHNFSVAGDTTPGTCVDKAATVMSCAYGCGETTTVYGDVDPANHKAPEVVETTAVAPTRGTAGKKADTICSACNALVEAGKEIPALGVDITVVGSTLGTATINGEPIDNDTKNVAYESAYTLSATANSNATFVGWMVNNKIVSKEPVYTTNAYADMTYVPVFAQTDANAFTVTFMDYFGNVTATISSADLPLAELPTAPTFAGLNFVEWSMTLEEVNALTEAVTVNAKYENDTEKTYTVSAPGCTIVADGVTTTDTATVTYNTLVKVTADGATAWTVNGSTAAYGSEYAFYCGSDITVAPITDAVTAKPEIKAVSYDKTATHQVTFLATRSIPENFQLVESGFVYGKGMTAEDLTLENVGKTVNGAVVKQAVCNNKGADGQFALTYGVKKMDASASAIAYIIYRDGAKTAVAYSDAMIYDYNA